MADVPSNNVNRIVKCFMIYIGNLFDSIVIKILSQYLLAIFMVTKHHQNMFYITINVKKGFLVF